MKLIKLHPKYLGYIKDPNNNHKVRQIKKYFLKDISNLGNIITKLSYMLNRMTPRNVGLSLCSAVKNITIPWP